MTAKVSLGALGALLALTLGASAQEILDERRQAQEDQVKANLHTILVNLERYAIDHRHYPDYVWGGTVESWLCHLEEDCDADRADIPDPLLAQGYLDAYPDNPFVNRRPAWCMLIPDPRFGCVPGEEYDYPDGPRRWLSMGNMLSDPRVEESTVVLGDVIGGETTPLYFLGEPGWTPNHPHQGHFIYRSFRVPWEGPGGCPAEGCAEKAIGFALGAYGSYHTVGSDHLHCADWDLGFEAPAGDACPGFEHLADSQPSHPALPGPDDAELRAIEHSLTPFGRVAIWTKELELLGSGLADVISRPCEFAADASCLPGGRTIGNPDGYPDGIIKIIHNWMLMDPPAGEARGWTHRIADEGAPE